MSILSIPVVNDLYANGVRKELISLPRPENTELIDSFSRAGKLVGNGNGMQYFGAILLKSALTEDELDSFYEQYRGFKLECVVEKQTGNNIDVLERGNGNNAFKEDMSDGDYYIVYSWGDSDYILRDLDIRGH